MGKQKINKTLVSFGLNALDINVALIFVSAVIIGLNCTFKLRALFCFYLSCYQADSPIYCAKSYLYSDIFFNVGYSLYSKLNICMVGLAHCYNQ